MKKTTLSKKFTIKSFYQERRKKTLLVPGMIGVLLFSICVLLSSCIETPAAQTLTLRLTSPNQGSRSILPDSALTIDHYTITGHGPDGNSFSITTSNQEVSIPGLMVGNWNVAVAGWNQDSIKMITGSADIVLGPDTGTTVIILDTLYGSGSCNISISWEADKVFNPELQVFLCPEGELGTDSEYAVPVNLSEGSATVTADLAAGAYTLRCVLYSNGEPVGGYIEAVRILDTLTTSGTVALDLDTLETTFSIAILPELTTPISGSISGSLQSIVTGEMYTLEFTAAEGTQLDAASLEAFWFLDGIAVGTGLQYSFTAPKGHHRVDVIVKNHITGSLGSTSWIFLAEDSGNPGSIRNIVTASHGTGNLLLDGASDALITPDGLIVVASKISDALSTFRIEAGVLVPKEQFQNSTATPMNGPVSISASKDGSIICLISEYSNSILIFTHTPGSDTLLPAAEFNGSMILNGTEIFFEKLSSSAVAEKDHFIYVADRSLHYIYQFSYDANGTAQAVGCYDFFFLQGVVGPKDIAISPDETTMAVACYDNSSLHILAITADTGELHAIADFSYALNGTLGISQIDSVFFGEGNEVFTTSNNYVCSFGKDAFGTWQPQIRLSEGDAIAAMSGPNDLTLSPDGQFLYICSTLSEGITILRRNGDSFDYFDFVSCLEGTPQKCSISQDGSLLCVTSNSDDLLSVYSIEQ